MGKPKATKGVSYAGFLCVPGGLAVIKKGGGIPEGNFPTAEEKKKTEEQIGKRN